METCEDASKKVSKSDKNVTCSTGEGCFCPKGKVLLKGKCVQVKECFPCDTENHYPGDEWYPSKCQKCKCNNDTTITCSKKDCPVSQTICGVDFLSVETSSPDDCCKKFACVPEPPKLQKLKCPVATLPKCGENQVNKMFNGTDGCPKYICGKFCGTATFVNYSSLCDTSN
jgi:hypothetical protein